MSELRLMDSLPTIDIKGKPYVMVVERIKHFRRMFPEGSIETIIHHMDNKQVVMIARIYPNKKDKPQWFAEGIAQEYIGTSGTAPAALLFGGSPSPLSATTEFWNGTSWGD